MIRNILYFLPILFLVSCKSNVAEQNNSAEEKLVQFKYQHEVRMPKTPSANPPLLLLLHGLGSNEKDLFSFAEYLDPRLLVVSARAPITLNENGFSWFKLARGSEGWTYDINQVEQAGNELISYLDQIIDHYKVDKTKVFVGGFSQGAIMSLTAGLNNSDKINGIICLSGRLYPELKPKLSSIKSFNGLQLFVSHGAKDEVLPYSDIVDDVAYLKSIGLDPTVKYYDAAHTISQDNFRDMVQWLAQRLN